MSERQIEIEIPGMQKLMVTVVDIGNGKVDVKFGDLTMDGDLSVDQLTRLVSEVVNCPIRNISFGKISCANFTF